MKRILAIALAILMLAGLATVAFADDATTETQDPNGLSAVGNVKYLVEVNLDLAGSIKLQERAEVNDGESYTIVAPDVAGYTFVKIIVDGEFEEASRQTKEYTSKSVTITPTGDVNVIIEYVKNATNNGPAQPADLGGDNAAAPAGPVDNSNTSPDTGVNFALIALVMMMSVCGIAVATKKLFE